MKKFSVIILALVLILSMLCLTSCSKQEITSMTVLDLPFAVVGEKVADHSITFQEQEGFSAVTEWQVWDAEEENFIPYENETFEDNKVYRPVGMVTLDKGYIFPEDEFLIVNMPEGYTDYGYMYNEETGIYEFQFGLRTTTTEIYKVEMLTPNFGIGNSIVIPEVKAYDGAGNLLENAVNSTLEWKYQELDSYDVLELKSSVFEENLEYILYSYITCNEGYSFAENTEIVTDGIETEEHYGSTPLILDKYTYFSTIQPLETFTLTGLPEAKAGVTMNSDLTLAEDYMDCYVGVNWIDADQNDVTDGTFESGKTYEAQVNICPPSTYTIAENPTVVIDGKTYSQDEMQVSKEEIYITIQYTIS